MRPWACVSVVVAAAIDADREPGLEPRAAVCLLGRLRGLASTAESIASQFLWPLRADVFVYLPFKFLREASAEDHTSLFGLPGLVEYVAEEENVTHSLLQQIRRAPVAATINAEQLLQWTSDVNGNWIGGLRTPDGKVRHGSGLAQMYAAHKCKEMIFRHEQANAFQYDWIIPSRFDVFWEAPHFPLNLFSTEAIWIPAGMDWGGYNDRHALIPRNLSSGSHMPGAPTAVEMYLDAWRFVRDGRAAMILHDAFHDLTNCKKQETDPDDSETSPPCLNTEAWLFFRLTAMGFRVSRLPTTFWLTCPANPPADVSVRHGSGHSFGECAARGTKYRYEVEQRNALEMSLCLRTKSKHSWWDSLDGVRTRVLACWCPPSIEREKFALRDPKYRAAMSLCFETKNDGVEVAAKSVEPPESMHSYRQANSYESLPGG